MLNMTEQELRGLRNLIAVMDRDDRPLNHPVAMLRLMMAFSPELDFLRKTMPWIQSQEETGVRLRMEEIVRRSLLDFNIREDRLDEAIALIRRLNGTAASDGSS